jgi:hypothetical protein
MCVWDWCVQDQCDQNNVQADMEEAGAETKYMDNLINKVGLGSPFL